MAARRIFNLSRTMVSVLATTDTIVAAAAAAAVDLVVVAAVAAGIPDPLDLVHHPST